MTCAEFEQDFAELDGTRSFEQEEHLKKCLHCSDLVNDFEAISQQARLLRGSEEPSPRVWRSLEAAMRQEGLIRGAAEKVSWWQQWNYGWLAPMAATFLIAFGVLFHQYQSKQTNFDPSSASTVQVSTTHQSNDEQALLKEVASGGQNTRSAYETDLRAVNAYVRDAEASVHDNPNDEIAQQYLMNAYEQKAMVYEMAMERSQQ
jgi:hypothetical protein